MTGLSEFRVPVGYLAPYLDGVYLAVNALPGAYLVYDARQEEPDSPPVRVASSPTAPWARYPIRGWIT